MCNPYYYCCMRCVIWYTHERTHNQKRAGTCCWELMLLLLQLLIVVGLLCFTGWINYLIVVAIQPDFAYAPYLAAGLVIIEYHVGLVIWLVMRAYCNICAEPECPSDGTLEQVLTESQHGAPTHAMAPCAGDSTRSYTVESYGARANQSVQIPSCPTQSAGTF